ncbi:MAG TPA: hypothetical protein VD741_02710, partial [Solirubrobacterales bacterium]|nr:hypothetical protein [Solirubrobacterales bacterium]
VEGEGSWQPDREFEVTGQPPSPPGQAVRAPYRLYDSSGELVREDTWPLVAPRPVVVPPVPGVYTLEAWLENAAGEQGAHAEAVLRFDDTAPLSPQLHPPGGWILAADSTALKMTAPSAPLPLSGLRGYAISLDRGGGSSPCAGPTRCAPGEIDFADPAEGSGTIPLGTLPEGINFVRVVAVSGAGVASPVAVAELRADGRAPLVSLRGLPGEWSDGPVELTALARDDLSGMAAAGPLGPFTAIAVNGAAAARAHGEAVTTTVAGSGIHSVEYFARDAAGNVADGASGGAQPARATVRIDEEPPTVAFSAAQDPADPERIEASLRDRLSGPSSDHGWIGVRPAGTRGRFQQLPTQVTAGRLIARWDSDSVPAGKYEFLATGFDAAGNVGTGTDRARGAKMVLVSPLKVPTFLEAGFLDRRAAKKRPASAPSGRDIRFGGRLRTTAGNPPAGLEVAVTEVFVAGAEPPRRTTFARTRGDGRFSIRLAPGPTREVVASFAGNRTLARASSERARLEVPASVRLYASAATARVGGAPIVFRGRVAGSGAKPAGVKGLPVELQFRFGQGGWREFRTVETDGRGRFRYAYRFSDDDSSGVRFQFRAYVKGREGWPYGPGSSRPITVTGR